MTLDKIKLITSKAQGNGELKTVEFKTSTASLYSACKALCSFLNADGGVVLIGVKDDGSLLGQNITDHTRQEIAREIKKFEPTAAVNIGYVLLTETRYIITMEVSAGEHAPYTYDGRAYQRLESCTSIMPQHLYEQLLVKRGQLNYTWEEFLADGTFIDDLDHEEITRTIKQAVDARRIPEDALHEDLTEILSRLELLQNGKLKNAAVVLFGKKMFPQFSQCMIKMARFKGVSELEDFIDNQQVYGHAFKILTEANEFMRKHLNVASFYQADDFVRIDKPTLPMLVIREALINAICHRNYQNYSAITLAIFDDRLEIWNSGFLPKELKIEDLKRKHGSYPRNRLIAEVFYKRGLIERWGTGTLKMLEKCKEYGLPEPQFAEYSDGLSVKFFFADLIGAKRTNDLMAKPTVKTSMFSKRQEEIMVLLEKHSKLTSLEILTKLVDQKIAARTLRDDLMLLKKHNLIACRGRGKNAIWTKVLK